MGLRDIHFFFEETDFNLKRRQTLREWLRDCCINEARKPGFINYIFCSDEYLLNINKQYLDHHYYTDIITFDQSDRPVFVDADIFISVDRAKDQANDFEVSFNEEIHRLMIHGLLHLLGYDDKSSADKQLMTEKEDYYLSLLAEKIK